MEESRNPSMDITNYTNQKPKYWIWDKKLPKTLCELLINESKTFTPLKTGLTGIGSDKKLRDTKITWAPSNHWIEGILLTHAFYANHNANWDYNVSYSEQVQIGIYDVGSHYDWHEDWFPFNTFQDTIRKISLTCLLNDSSEFEGGEFQFDFSEKLKLEQGTIIAFPSFLKHKVHPVTSGTRISAVSWILGDPTF
jgi:PKHD-type hydroxylase